MLLFDIGSQLIGAAELRAKSREAGLRQHQDTIPSRLVLHTSQTIHTRDTGGSVGQLATQSDSP